MEILNKLEETSKIKTLSVNELKILAAELREELVKVVSLNGGHLASNLGVVELTMALHYCFDLPNDKIVWDVSHQTYVHKLLTGRRECMQRLRQIDGCAGFASKDESKYDVFGAGHAGTAISAALGLAAARDLKKGKEKIIAVLGDGALSCGISYEGLNNIANVTKNMIIILNDNQMSISENVGGMTSYLNNIIQRPGYNKLRSKYKELILRIPKIGTKIRKTVDKLEELAKGVFVPGIFFEELGIRYIGPVNGHDLPTLIKTLTLIKEFDSPVIIHAITEKGKGYKPAETSPEKFHGLGKFDPKTGNLCNVSNTPTYSSAFGESVVKLADKYNNIVAITAAMTCGTGLKNFATKYPERFYDVGIAEEHAVIFAAGLAANGIRPIFAVYSTFLQRSLSSIYHDICIQNLPVIICADRSGIVEDGPTHHGIYDISYLRAIPNLTIFFPATQEDLSDSLEKAYLLNSPVLIKYSKGNIPNFVINEKYQITPGKSHVIKQGKDVSIWALGSECYTAFMVVEILNKSGIDAEIINTISLKPFDSQLLKEKAKDNIVVTLEDNTLSGGLASVVAEILINAPHKKIISIGWDDSVIPYGPPEKVKQKFNFTPESIAEQIISSFKEN